MNIKRIRYYEDNKKRIKAQSAKKHLCKFCKCEVSHITRHNRTIKHLNNL